MNALKFVALALLAHGMGQCALIVAAPRLANAYTLRYKVAKPDNSFFQCENTR